MDRCRTKHLASRRTNLRRFPGSIVSLLASALLAAVVALAHSAPASAFVICEGLPHISNGHNNGPINALPDNWYFDIDTATCGSSDSGFGRNRGFSHPEPWTIGNGPLGGFRIATDDDDLSIAEAYPGVDAEGNSTPGVGRDGSNRNAQAFTTCHSKLLRINDPDLTDPAVNYEDDWDNTAYRVCGVGGGARYRAVRGERMVIQLTFTGARDGVTYNVVADLTAHDIIGTDNLPGWHLVHSIMVYGGVFGEAPDTVAMRNFMLRRAMVLIDEEPDLVGRLKGDFGNVTASNLLGLTGHGEKDNFNLSFQTSMRTMFQVGQAESRARMEEFRRGETLAPDGSLFVNGDDLAPGAALREDVSETHKGLAASGDAAAPDAASWDFDVWAKGKFIYSDGEDWESETTLLYLGADYRFSPDLMAGFIAQFDWTNESTEHISRVATGTKATGVGWIVGPYAVMRLTDNLYVDGRGAYGQSYNRIDVFQLLGDEAFNTERWLVRAQVTGDFSLPLGPVEVSVSPFVRGVYFEEWMTGGSGGNQFGVSAPDLSISIARVTFGPKISTQFSDAAGRTYAPYLTLSGSWDPTRSDDWTDTSGFTVDSGAALNARLETGLAWTWPGLFTLRGNLFVSGFRLAEDYNSYGGSLTMSIPLN